MKNPVSQLLKREDGAVMAEFVLTLPIFIMCFVGIVQLGLFSERSIKVWANAHRNTFAQATVINQVRFSGPFLSPVGGALMAGAGLATGGKPFNQSGIQRGIVLAAETTTYADMGFRGHWGESSTRTAPFDLVVNMHPDIEGKRTGNSTEIIGESRLTADLVNDRVNFSGSAGGALGALNALLSGTGSRPAIAAGQRYGTVTGWSTDSVTVARRTVSMRAHFNTLVPPFPLAGAEAQFLPTAVVRITMMKDIQP